MVCISFSESFANPVLDFTESDKEFTAVGSIGIWITSLGNCFAEYIQSDLESCDVLSLVEEVHGYSLMLYSDFEERGIC